MNQLERRLYWALKAKVKRYGYDAAECKKRRGRACPNCEAQLRAERLIAEIETNKDI